MSSNKMLIQVVQYSTNKRMYVNIEKICYVRQVSADSNEPYMALEMMNGESLYVHGNADALAEFLGVYKEYEHK